MGASRSPAAEDPDVEWARSAIAAVVADLENGPYSLESGLAWAAAVLASGGRRELVVTTNDAGWIPPGTRLPRGVRLLWRHKDLDRWATVDDPVRPLLELAAIENLTVAAVATTHRSRAHQPTVGLDRFAVVTAPGTPADPSGARDDRLAFLASPQRIAHIRSLAKEAARIQTIDLALDAIDQLPAGADSTRSQSMDIVRYLQARTDIPANLSATLAETRAKLVTADRSARVPSASIPLGDPFPPAAALAKLRLEAGVAEAVLAAECGDLEAALAAWTIVRARAKRLAALVS